MTTAAVRWISQFSHPQLVNLHIPKWNSNLMKWQQIKNDFILQIDSDDFMWHQLQEAAAVTKMKKKTSMWSRKSKQKRRRRRRRKTGFCRRFHCKWNGWMQKDNYTTYSRCSKQLRLMYYNARLYIYSELEEFSFSLLSAAFITHIRMKLTVQIW